MSIIGGSFSILERFETPLSDNPKMHLPTPLNLRLIRNSASPGSYLSRFGSSSSGLDCRFSYARAEEKRGALRLEGSGCKLTVCI